MNLKNRKASEKLQFYSDLHYSCINCGKCCTRVWDIPVTEFEKAKIEKLDIPGIDFSETNYFKSYKRSSMFILGKKDDRCLFLDDQNFCLIHKYHGEKAKPLACRLYPFDIINWQDGIISASFKFNCPAVVKKEGKSILLRKGEITRFAKELLTFDKKSDVCYNHELKLDLNKIRIVNKAYQNLLLNQEIVPSLRLYAAVSLLNRHSKKEFREELKTVKSSFPHDIHALVMQSIGNLAVTIQNTVPLNVNNRVIFRYLLSGFARVDEEAIAYSSFGRISRAIKITKFFMGIGTMHDLYHDYPDTQGIDPLQACTEVKFPASLFVHIMYYISAKLYSMHFCGTFLLKLTYEEGMRLLLMTYPAIYAFSTLFAKVDNRNEVKKEDIEEAIMIVDHTFSNSPFFTLKKVKRVVKKICSDAAFPALLNLMQLD